MWRKTMLVVSVCAVAVSAAATYVAPKNDSVGVFANELRKLSEKPVCTAGTGARLTVLQTGRDSYKVQTAEGCEGWVEKQLVGAFSASRQIVYDPADVLAELDNVRPIMVWGPTEGLGSEVIPLTRSFSEALRENTDRESIERQTP